MDPVIHRLFSINMLENFCRYLQRFGTFFSLVYCNNTVYNIYIYYYKICSNQLLLVRLLVDRKLLVVKFWGGKVYTEIFYCVGV